MSRAKELSLRDRYMIERSLKRGLTHKEIAEFLGVTRQCIDYEVKKGKVAQRDTYLRQFFVYKADYADRVAKERKQRTGRKRKYLHDSEILKSIEEKLLDRYSPYAAIKSLGIEGAISEKTVYNYIHAKHFEKVRWYNMPNMKKDKRSEKRVGKIAVPFERSIEARDKSILKRESFGHWEMDTIYSAKNEQSCLLTMTERETRTNFSIPIASRTQTAVAKALRGAEQTVGSNTFKEIFKTVTCDNGMEFRDYGSLEKTMYSAGRKRTHIFYAHPYCSSERGSNENQNRMIRRFIPKGDDIGLYSRADIRDISRWINTYPRKLFNGQSSIDMVRNEYALGNISQKAYDAILRLAGVV